MDKQQADKIITEYLPKIYGFSLKNSFSYNEAEEICADIAKELYEALLKLKDIYNLDGYVWRICKHVYSKYVSTVKKHQGVSLDCVELCFEDTYDLGDTEEELLRLRREITFLTKTRREIVYAYYYENVTKGIRLHFLNDTFLYPADTPSAFNENELRALDFLSTCHVKNDISIN